MSVRTQMKWHGAQVDRRTREAAADALFDAAEYLLEQSNRSVPHDEGTLQASGETSVDRDRLEAAVSYDTPYAARLHEHPEYRFRKGRRGKWLERTVNEQRGTIAQLISDKLRRRF